MKIVLFFVILIPSFVLSYSDYGKDEQPSSFGSYYGNTNDTYKNPYNNSLNESLNSPDPYGTYNPQNLLEVVHKVMVIHFLSIPVEKDWEDKVL